MQTPRDSVGGGENNPSLGSVRGRDKAKKRAYDREYNVRNKERIAARRLAWQRANPERVRAAKRKHRYGITASEYAALIEAQSGRCACCPATVETNKRPFDVDHDHVSGQVRGLLCRHCNLALGGVRDNADTLARMIEYLNHHRRLRVVA